LGLKNKGHLGLGADADIAIYDVNPEETDSSKEYKVVRKAFEKAAYTIKGGEIASQNGEIVKHVEGATIWLDIQVSTPWRVTEDIKKKFREYWTVEYENYPVSEHYLAVSHPIPLKAGV
jgi:formylmethanofuran dehydrogenase subunit A